MIIGYARVSTKDQNLDLQVSAVKNAGCAKIFKEKLSAVKDRPELDLMISTLRKNDTIIVWKLDRLGRSLRHLVNLMTEFKSLEIEFISLSDSIDTTTPQGRLMFNLFASFAEFERELISERTRAGISAMKERNPGGGRVRGLSQDNIKKVSMAKSLSQRGDMKPADIYKSLGISKASMERNTHNIWVSPINSKKKSRIYHEKHLDELIIQKDQRLNCSESLLSLISICDTIEPLKSFSQFKPNCILNKLDITTSTSDRIINITTLDKCINLEPYFENIKYLEEWLNVVESVNETKTSITIKIIDKKNDLL